MPTRKTRPKLPRQRQQPPAVLPAQQARARIASNLDDTIGACEDLFREHGEDCECETCNVVSNLVGAVRVFHMLLQIT